MEVGQCSVRHVEAREYIRAESALELLTGNPVEALLWVLFGGVVDQDVEPAELRHDVVYGLPAEALIAHVSRQRQAASALFFHEGSGLLRVAVFIEVYHSHIGPFLGESDSHGAPDPTVPSGDEGDFVLQLATAPVRPGEAQMGHSARTGGLTRTAWPVIRVRVMPSTCKL
jgi:hypothetical protein